MRWQNTSKKRQVIYVNMQGISVRAGGWVTAPKGQEEAYEQSLKGNRNFHLEGSPLPVGSGGPMRKPQAGQVVSGTEITSGVRVSPDPNPKSDLGFGLNVPASQIAPLQEDKRKVLLETGGGQDRAKRRKTRKKTYSTRKPRRKASNQLLKAKPDSSVSAFEGEEGGDEE